MIRLRPALWPTLISLPILVLSMHDENVMAERVLLLGARGYLMKDDGAAKLEMAMRQILLGKIAVSVRVQERVLASLRKRTSECPGDSRCSATNPS